MSTSTTRLTNSSTPTCETRPQTPHLSKEPPQRAVRVQFSPESQFRAESPDSLRVKHEFTIITGLAFENSPEARHLYSPDTISRIEKERDEREKSTKSKPLRVKVTSKPNYSELAKNCKEEEQQGSYWFPVLSLSFAILLGLGLYFDGEGSSQK